LYSPEGRPVISSHWQSREGCEYFAQPVVRPGEEQELKRLGFLAKFVCVLLRGKESIAQYERRVRVTMLGGLEVSSKSARTWRYWSFSNPSSIDPMFPIDAPKRRSLTSPGERQEIGESGGIVSNEIEGCSNWSRESTTKSGSESVLARRHKERRSGLTDMQRI
jgi:hypothetical protein